MQVCHSLDKGTEMVLSGEGDMSLPVQYIRHTSNMSVVDSHVYHLHSHTWYPVGCTLAKGTTLRGD